MILEVLKDKEPSALATIVDVKGSAYRKEGASMIIKADDSHVGVLSGGCLEQDLHFRAKEIFVSGHSKVFEYDLSAEDDLGWGLGAGCNGIVSVLIRNIDCCFRISLLTITRHLSNKSPVLFIQSMKDMDSYAFISRSGDRIGSFKSVIPLEINSVLHSTSPFRKVAEQRIIDGQPFFVQLIWPTPELYIFGAGEDARPLANLAGSAGYTVNLLDWREGLVTEEYFPSVQTRQVGGFSELIASTSFSSLDSVVIMTHDFQRDKTIVENLIKVPLFYFGILGSKKRTERLIGGKIPDWIHSPVGLSIGADGPAEIAVSILAEMISIKNGGITDESSRNLLGSGEKSAHGYAQ
ncbi:XdhC family protein [Sporosarcina sp. 6E9]|uniref:XdhC family protein n=1 Tax=Sporosarcina sp. 6E9 TaxID=2819235 RepID=UPI001B3060FA|nr:XdhC family protein [Sporosarcina sp. 6E9]